MLLAKLKQTGRRMRVGNKEYTALNDHGADET